MQAASSNNDGGTSADAPPRKQLRESQDVMNYKTMLTPLGEQPMQQVSQKISPRKASLLDSVGNFEKALVAASNNFQSMRQSANRLNSSSRKDLFSTNKALPTNAVSNRFSIKPQANAVMKQNSDLSDIYNPTMSPQRMKSQFSSTNQMNPAENIQRKSSGLLASKASQSTLLRGLEASPQMLQQQNSVTSLTDAQLASSIKRVKKALEMNASPGQLSPSVLLPSSFNNHNHSSNAQQTQKIPHRREPNNVQIKFQKPKAAIPSGQQQQLREESSQPRRSELSGSVLKLIPPTGLKSVSKLAAEQPLTVLNAKNREIIKKTQGSGANQSNRIKATKVSYGTGTVKLIKRNGSVVDVDASEAQKDALQSQSSLAATLQKSKESSLDIQLEHTAANNTLTEGSRANVDIQTFINLEIKRLQEESKKGQLTNSSHAMNYSSAHKPNATRKNSNENQLSEIGSIKKSETRILVDMTPSAVGRKSPTYFMAQVQGQRMALMSSSKTTGHNEITAPELQIRHSVNENHQANNSRQEQQHHLSSQIPPFKTVTKSKNHHNQTVDQKPRGKSLAQELIEHHEEAKDRDQEGASKNEKSFQALQKGLKHLAQAKHARLVGSADVRKEDNDSLPMLHQSSDVTNSYSTQIQVEESLIHGAKFYQSTSHPVISETDNENKSKNRIQELQATNQSKQSGETILLDHGIGSLAANNDKKSKAALTRDSQIVMKSLQKDSVQKKSHKELPPIAAFAPTESQKVMLLKEEQKKAIEEIYQSKGHILPQSAAITKQTHSNKTKESSNFTKYQSISITNAGGGIPAMKTSKDDKIFALQSLQKSMNQRSKFKQKAVSKRTNSNGVTMSQQKEDRSADMHEFIKSQLSLAKKPSVAGKPIIFSTLDAFNSSGQLASDQANHRDSSLQLDIRLPENKIESMHNSISLLQKGQGAFAQSSVTAINVNPRSSHYSHFANQQHQKFTKSTSKNKSNFFNKSIQQRSIVSNSLMVNTASQNYNRAYAAAATQGQLVSLTRGSRTNLIKKNSKISQAVVAASPMRSLMVSPSRYEKLGTSNTEEYFKMSSQLKVSQLQYSSQQQLDIQSQSSAQSPSVVFATSQESADTSSKKSSSALVNPKSLWQAKNSSPAFQQAREQSQLLSKASQKGLKSLHRLIGKAQAIEIETNKNRTYNAMNAATQQAKKQMLSTVGSRLMKTFDRSKLNQQRQPFHNHGGVAHTGNEAPQTQMMVRTLEPITSHQGGAEVLAYDESFSSPKFSNQNRARAYQLKRGKKAAVTNQQHLLQRNSPTSNEHYDRTLSTIYQPMINAQELSNHHGAGSKSMLLMTHQAVSFSNSRDQESRQQYHEDAPEDTSLNQHLVQDSEVQNFVKINQGSQEYSGGLPMKKNKKNKLVGNSKTMSRKIDGSQSSKSRKGSKKARQEALDQVSHQSRQSNKRQQSKAAQTSQFKKDALDFQQLVVSGDPAKFKGSLPVPSMSIQSMQNNQNQYQTVVQEKSTLHTRLNSVETLNFDEMQAQAMLQDQSSKVTTKENSPQKDVQSALSIHEIHAVAQPETDQFMTMENNSKTNGSEYGQSSPKNLEIQHRKSLAANSTVSEVSSWYQLNPRHSSNIGLRDQLQDQKALPNFDKRNKSISTIPPVPDQPQSFIFGQQTIRSTKRGSASSGFIIETTTVPGNAAVAGPTLQESSSREGFTAAKPTQFELTNEGAVPKGEQANEDNAADKQKTKSLMHNASTESLYDEHQKRDNNMAMVRVILRKRDSVQKGSKQVYQHANGVSNASLPSHVLQQHRYSSVGQNTMMSKVQIKLDQKNINKSLNSSMSKRDKLSQHKGYLQRGTSLAALRENPMTGSNTSIQFEHNDLADDIKITSLAKDFSKDRSSYDLMQTMVDQHVKKYIEKKQNNNLLGDRRSVPVSAAASGYLHDSDSQERHHLKHQYDSSTQKRSAVTSQINANKF